MITHVLHNVSCNFTGFTPIKISDELNSDIWRSIQTEQIDSGWQNLVNITPQNVHASCLTLQQGMFSTPKSLRLMLTFVQPF